LLNQKCLEPLSILTKYKTSVTPKIDNIFYIYLRFDYISVDQDQTVMFYPDNDWNIVKT
jgi:hypothetical protein